jgi:hypothetical protein
MDTAQAGRHAADLLDRRASVRSTGLAMLEIERDGRLEAVSAPNDATVSQKEEK